MSLKETLLSLGCFEDNKYLDFYYNLIENNRHTKKEKFKTQRHHIIPKCYYKENSLELDNSSDNLVNLLYKDHILAHYYLCRCVERDHKQFLYKLENSYLHLIKGNSNYKIYNDEITEEELLNYQKIYEDWKILNSELQKGRTSWNKGLTKESDERVRKYSKPRHFSKEHNEHNSQSLRKYYKTHENPMLGRHLTAEQRMKVSLASKGRKKILKNKEIASKRLSDSLKNYWNGNKEARNRLAEYNKTRVLSSETHQKMSEAQPTRCEVVQLDANLNVINKFASVHKCSVCTHIGVYRIKGACISGHILDNTYYFISEKISKVVYDALLKYEEQNDGKED